jgi:IS605 OrfB family transposase
VLTRRRNEVKARMEQAKMSICRGGKSLARAHHHLDQAGLSQEKWQELWRARRQFITADGEKDKAWGNETIRWHPDEGWVEIKLPPPLSQLANRPHGRYRLSGSVEFSYRGQEVAAQAATGAVRYDISYSPAKARWYLDASWHCALDAPPTMGRLREHPVLAVDVNGAHLAAMVVDPSGNPTGPPITVPLTLAGLPGTTSDGHLRAAISQLIQTARKHHCEAVVIENLDFWEARESGREHTGRRPSRGRRGRSFRRLVSGIPTARFRNGLVQMATNTGLAVIAIDPAYTSTWGAEHWLGAMQEIFDDASGHHAAALVIARRGLGQPARRRERCGLTPAAHGQERAADSAVRPVPAGKPAAGLSKQRNRDPGTRTARGQPQRRHKTQPAKRTTSGDQVTQDRSGPPTGRDSVPLSV